MTNVAKFIKYQRVLRGMTQRQIAKEFGWFMGQNVSNIERGLGTWSDKDLPKLCELLKIKKSELREYYLDDCRVHFDNLFKD